jgi:hypothetical protein
MRSLLLSVLLLAVLPCSLSQSTPPSPTGPCNPNSLTENCARGPNWQCAGNDCHCPAGFWIHWNDDDFSTLTCEACPHQSNLPGPYEADRYECPCSPGNQWITEPFTCAACPAHSTGSPGGYAHCNCESGRLFCQSQCIDPQNTENHCGSCFNSCDVGEICRLGNCVCSRFYFPKQDTCVECTDESTRFFGANGQNTCPCEVGYYNFDPATGKCTAAKPVNNIYNGFPSVSNDGSSGWTFGTTDKSGSPASFTPLTIYGDSFYSSAVSCWTNTPAAQRPFACITKSGHDEQSNSAGFVFRGKPAVNFAPGGDNRKAAARFKIPSTGTYWIVGVFDGGNTDATSDVRIQLNGGRIWGDVLATVPCGDGTGCTVFAAKEFRFSIYAKQGDKLDFLVGTQGSPGNDFVNLKARVILAAEQNCNQNAPCGSKNHGYACCGNNCLDLFRDDKNCGACGHSCAKEERCCDGICQNTKIDPDNCSFCGNRCLSPTPFCTAGKCHD